MPSPPLLALLTRLGVSRPVAARYLSRGRSVFLSWALAAFLFYASSTLLFSAWPSIVAAIPSSWLGSMLVLTTCTNVSCQVIFNLALWPIYATGVWDGWKAEPTRPWPWTRAADAATRARFWAAVRKTFPLVATNMTLVAGLGLVALAPIVSILGLTTPLETAALPTLPTLAAHLIFCLMIEDAMFFASHSLLHTPFFYSTVHKTHHEYSSVIGIASEHAHPLEFVMGNLLPVITGPLLLRAHAATTILFLMLRLAVSVEEHSGFALPWSPLRCSPWGALAEGHAWHHTHTVGVFASQFGWWDAAFGTSAAFERWLEATDKVPVVATAAAVVKKAPGQDVSKAFKPQSPFPDAISAGAAAHAELRALVDAAAEALDAPDPSPKTIRLNERIGRSRRSTSRPAQT